jgi:hypothetical protein
VEIEVLGISVENVPGYARLYQDSRVVWPEGWSGEDGSAVAFCPEHRGKGVL